MKIYFATALVDMRNGIDGLRAVVEQVLERDPNEGHLFVFVGKARDKLEILFWDRNGYVVYFKRLERGRFHVPQPLHVGAPSVTIDLAELTLILDGVGLSASKLRARTS